MRVDGQCQCGAIEFAAEIEPETVNLCHCIDCQTMSGTAFQTNVRTAKDGFELITGEPRLYTKIAESGAPREYAFCPECGTSIYARSPAMPGLYGLRVGTLRQRNELPPKVMQWWRSAQSWVRDTDIAELPYTEKQPGDVR